MSEKVFGSMKDLKVGKFVLIDDEPCKVLDIQTSAPGKHGAAKMRVSAVGIFDSQKRTLLKPSDADVEIPIIERKTGQIVSLNGDIAQLMDGASFEVFELPVPEELKQEAGAGKEVDYMEAMGKKIMTRIHK